MFEIPWRKNMEQKLQQFIEKYVDSVRPLLKELYTLHWDYDTTGDNSLVERKIEIEKKYKEIVADKNSFLQLQEFKKSGMIHDTVLKRQLDCLLNEFGMSQGNPENIKRIIQLESEINTSYNQYRGKVDGRELNDNEIKKMLHNELDLEMRKKAWEASKQIGQEVAQKVIEVVKLRNENARSAGYSDYYTMALSHKDLDEKKMFHTLDRLAQLSDEPFRQLKEKMDNDLAQKFGISAQDMRPWHYADPFFQQPPPHKTLDVDQFYEHVDIEQLMIDTYDSIDMDIRDILEKSDLYPKDKKCQHAYCTFIDREAKDVRILCNIAPNEQWTSTTLHEFGHAVYDKYIDSDLPYILIDTPHTLSTEAIAMMMDTLSKNPKWLTDFVKIDSEKITPIHDTLIQQERLTQFVFIRWGLVMVNFERELYKNPDQDLNKLWWDYVEKYQYVTRPENRDKPDWAAKIHLALCPVYYQNYIYGELVSAQLQDHIKKQVGNGELFGNKDLGTYLKDKYFASGAKYDWNETLKNATGAKLDPKHFVEHSLGISLA